MSTDGITTEIRAIDPKLLVRLEKNARFMPHEQYQQLVSNVRRDGRLTSVPLAALMEDGERYEVLSGNHRVSAAIDVGLREIEVMFIDQQMTRPQRVAIQLAHNSIAGQDDPALLKALYDEIDSIDYREYAGLDDKTLDLLESIHPGSLSEAQLEFTTITIMFLPEEVTALKRVLAEALAMSGGADETWIAKYSQHSELLEALSTVSRSYDVTNVARSLEFILDIFRAHVGDVVDGWWDQQADELRQTAKWIPLQPLIGGFAPPEAARTIAKAIASVNGGDDKLQGWQAIHTLAQTYLETRKNPPKETPEP